MSFTAFGRSSYGAVVGDGVVDLGRRLGDRFPSLRAAIAGGALDRAAAEVSGAAPDIALSQVTLLPPITDPDKIICAGRNYRAHAAEAGGPPPENPQVFLRLVNTLVAHNQPMVCPKISGEFDYEGALALIIGKPGRHIAKPDALSHVNATPASTTARSETFSSSIRLLPARTSTRPAALGRGSLPLTRFRTPPAWSGDAVKRQGNAAHRD